MKNIAAGYYSFRFEDSSRITDFLKEEGQDSLNKETHDRNVVSVNNTLSTVKKLDSLFLGVTQKKKFLKSSLKDLYTKKFSVDEQKAFEMTETWQNVSLSSSSYESSSEDDAQSAMQIDVK